MAVNTYAERILSEQRAMKPIRNSSLVCKDCKYRKDDSEVFGNTTKCEKYTHKPDAVLKGADCEHYEKEV